jgi:hypothetical protein
LGGKRAKEKVESVKKRRKDKKNLGVNFVVLLVFGPIIRPLVKYVKILEMSAIFVL